MVFVETRAEHGDDSLKVPLVQRQLNLKVVYDNAAVVEHAPVGCARIDMHRIVAYICDKTGITIGRRDDSLSILCVCLGSALDDVLNSGHARPLFWSHMMELTLTYLLQHAQVGWLEINFGRTEVVARLAMAEGVYD